MPGNALLITNADDFGFTHDVNAGIVTAHRDGILTATTLMANGPAFEHAVVLAKQNPKLDIGCHLVLVQGPGLPNSVSALLTAIARKQIDIYAELERQVRKILQAGIQPTHLDTHKHTHLAPPVLRAVIRISREFGIPWVRRPVDFPGTRKGTPFGKRMVHLGVRALGSRFARHLREAGCRTTDYFTGFQVTGRLGTPELVEMIYSLPDGVTELMCHPGLCGEELRAATTRLKESRFVEWKALCSPEARKALRERGARLVSYRDL